MDAAVDLGGQLLGSGGDIGCVDWGSIGGSALTGAAQGAAGGALGNLAKVVRVARAGKEGTTKTIVISRSRHPESAAHIREAQNAGQPSILTIDRTGARARRREALTGQKSHPGKDRDEYPPAMFEEGGAGSSVRNISLSDNRGAGACIGAQCRGLPNGTRVNIKVE